MRGIPVNKNTCPKSVEFAQRRILVQEVRRGVLALLPDELRQERFHPKLLWEESTAADRRSSPNSKFSSLPSSLDAAPCQSTPQTSPRQGLCQRETMAWQRACGRGGVGGGVGREETAGRSCSVTKRLPQTIGGVKARERQKAEVICVPSFIPFQFKERISREG